MSPKQKKLAGKAPPPNKIDAKDFAVLRAEKAKGRGMGLQDEKVQPGKVMKAKEGEFIKRRKALRGVNPFSKIKSGLDLPVISSVKPGSKIGKGKKTTLEQVRKEKGFKPGETPSKFNKRRMALEAGKKALSKTRIGKIALGVGAAGVAAQQYLKSKMKKKDEPKKKMGGGMMQKYSKGGGADSGTEGERRSAIGVYTNKIKRFLKDAPSMSKRDFDRIRERTKTYALANSMKDKDRLTDRDIDMAKKAISRVKAKRAQQGFLRTDPMPKKMGGGMMQKPMGYSKGGGFDSGTPGKVRDMLNSTVIKEKGKFAKIFGGKPTKRKMDKLVEIGIPKVKKIITSKKYMGGGMMQKPMGYSKGVSVKARGCKLGRTKPTKIT